MEEMNDVVMLQFKLHRFNMVEFNKSAFVMGQKARCEIQKDVHFCGVLFIYHVVNEKII